MFKLARVVPLFLLVATLVGLAAAVRAAAIAVNTTADELNSDGDCSLREAIRAANLDAAVDACPAGSGADTITIPAGTYTLTLTGADEDLAAAGDLDLASNITLNGAGSALTIINANGIDRVFHVTGAFTVQISGVTIRGGNVSGPLDYGGGIANSGALTLTNSIVTGNTANFSGGGIGNLGSLTVNNSTISDNTAVTGVGGGISNNNSLEVGNSTISGNRALGGTSDGGGIANNGAATIADSAITGNESGDDGGGLRNFGAMTVTNSTVRDNIAAAYGGGLANKSGLTVTASAVSGNTAYNDGGGLYHEEGALALTNVTVSGNFSREDGGGLHVNSLAASANLNNITVTANTADGDSNGTGNGGGLASAFSATNFKNTILAANIDAGGQAADCSGAVNSQDHNLIQSAAGCTIGGVTTNNVTGQSASLGPLQDNGGATFTHALLAGSPAIDAGNNATCATVDQRGIPRPRNGVCDIGAYEMDTAAPTATPTVGLTPALNFPHSGAQSPTLRPLFDWSNVAEATSYTIQISTSQNFTTLVLNINVTPSAYWMAADLPRNTLLFWRVRANGPGGPGAWSRVRHFFSASPPGAPGALAPANAAVVSSKPTLDWSDSTPGAEHYEVQISADPSFSLILGRGQGGRVNVSVYTVETALSSGGVYYWRVRAVSGGASSGGEQFSQWSVARSFRVQ